MIGSLACDILSWKALCIMEEHKPSHHVSYWQQTHTNFCIYNMGYVKTYIDVIANTTYITPLRTTVSSLFDIRSESRVPMKWSVAASTPHGSEWTGKLGFETKSDARPEASPQSHVWKQTERQLFAFCIQHVHMYIASSSVSSKL